MKKILFFLSFFPSLCSAFEEDPWYSDFLEFNFLASYNYSFFNKVDHGQPPVNTLHQTQVFSAELGVTAPENWNWQAELEMADVTNISFGYRSFAFQMRTLWLNDVCGDPLSLSTGLVYRDASAKFRKALSTPYHGRANFEFQISAGKEWNYGCDWFFRIYGIGAVGQATSGNPWIRGDLFFWVNFQEKHQFRFYERSLFGLGKREIVPLDDFDGWGGIGHQSIDLGISYRYQFGLYGSLRFDYLHRVYARSFPEHVNFFILCYKFPFSIF